MPRGDQNVPVRQSGHFNCSTKLRTVFIHQFSMLSARRTVPTKARMVFRTFFGGGLAESKELKVGSKLADFPEASEPLQGHDGKPVVLTSFIGRSPLVLFFYPKADTPGCTKQACKFRDEHQVFVDAGATVFGISSDNVESNSSFAAKRQLPFPLLSDTGGMLRRAFGVQADLLGLIPGRQTYVFNKAGTCVLSYNSQLNAEQHVAEALGAIRGMSA